MDLFEKKNLAPMLIGASDEAFDSNDHIFELKFDGERAIAYLGPEGTELRNKRNKRVLPVFPELGEIHRQVGGRCILDGEYVAMVNGRPQFSTVQRRSLMSNPFRIKLAADKQPICFVAFDILYLDGRQLTDLPLLERKVLLQKTVSESPRLAVSRFVEERGKTLYELTERENLEGVVAKVKDSKYYFGKRTREWVKIKNLQDEDFVICGYIFKDNHMVSLVLGRYHGNELIYEGHVTLGVSGSNFRRIREQERLEAPPFAVPPGHGNEKAIWIRPELVGTVSYMERTAKGGMRQPVFKGLREDKQPRDTTD